MTPVWAHPQTSPELYEAICRFVSQRVWGDGRTFPSGTAMGVGSGDRIVAAVLFYNYDSHAGTVELSAASDDRRWLTREILREMFDFAFNQMGCQAAVMRCDPDDKVMARIAPAYGFARIDLPRMRGRGKAEAVYILGDDEWRANGFHKENRDGQKERP